MRRRWRAGAPWTLATPLRLVAMLCLASLAGCFTVESPDRGQPLEPRAGQSLIFGRVEIVGLGGEEYFPESRRASGLWSLVTPRPHLNLMKLGPRGGRGMATSELAVRPDGSFAAWVPVGDYALLAISPSDGHEATVDEIALLRVPTGELAVYTGDLIITVEISILESMDLSELYYVRGANVDEGSLPDAQNSLEQRHGPLSRQPAVSLWCTNDLPGLIDQYNARSRKLLDRGCRTSP